ncbi:MAG: hypothetical protein AMXMBFR64_16120 [Myxococcales bacterium]
MHTPLPPRAPTERAAASQMIRGALPLALVLLVGLWSGAASAQVCARVKIEIVQELTLERQAFDAKLKVTNGATDVPLTHLGVEVSFRDASGGEVVASSDPSSLDASFFVALDSLDGVDAVDGTGTIAGGGVGEVHWLIIPAPGAAGPGGTLYFVGARLTYRLGTEEHTTDVAPDTITVRPMPELHLDYFLPDQVHGDNPYTDPEEPPEPFTLGLRASNQGFGVAEKLAIESAQPKIVENEQGLLIAFEIIGSEVDGAPATTSLKVDLGDVQPGEASVARWFMTSTLQGKFVSFEASFTHADALGGKLTSLLEEVRTHLLVHDLRVDLPGRDAHVDFLAYDAVGNLTLYESDLVDSAVWDASDEAELLAAGPDAWNLAVPPTGGFSWARVDDPNAGTRVIASVVRADGRVLAPDAAWLSRVWVKDSQSYLFYVNVFDTGNPLGLPYVVTFGGMALANYPPVLGFLPDRAVAAGDALAYGVAATDPDGTVPTVQVGHALPAGATFAALGGGEGRLDWTPTAAQVGSYPILFEATDGKLFDKAVATIHVVPAGTPNSPPSAVEAAIQTTVGTPSPPVTPTVVDLDPDDQHFFQITAAPAHGAAVVVQNQLVYTPSPGYKGPDSFGIRAVDLFGEAVDGLAQVLVTGYDNLAVESLEWGPEGVTVGVRLDGTEAPVTPVVLEVRAAGCGIDAVVGSVELLPQPGLESVVVAVELPTDRALVLVAVLDATDALPEPDELDNRASIPVATGAASTATLSIGSSGSEQRKSCAGQALAMNGRATWSIAEASPCGGVPAAGQPMVWALRDLDGAPVRQGSGQTDAFGAWHLETGLPAESMALYDLDVTVGTQGGTWSTRLLAVPCPAAVPPPMVPAPPYPGPSGAAVVVFSDGTAVIPWLVHPGTPIPTAGHGGSGARGATWGTGASDQTAPGGPILGARGGVVGAFDAAAGALTASAAKAGEPVTLRGTVTANDSYWGLPVGWTAEGPAGTLPIAPTTWFYANGTLHVAATWTPPAGGAWTITLRVGPALGDTDPTNDTASLVVDVAPQVPSLDGLALWLDGTSGVSTDAEGRVAGWADRSGRAMDAAQPDAAARPDALAGGVRFHGASSLVLPDGFAALGDGLTVIAVVAPDQASPMGVLDLGPGPMAPRIGLGLDADARVRWQAGARVVAGGVEAELAAPQVVTVVHGGTLARALVGGVEVLAEAARVPKGGEHAGNRVGASGDPALASFRGELRALLVYERPLPDGERAALEAWLADRHGAWHPGAAWVEALPEPAQALAATHHWSQAEAEAWVAWDADNPGEAIPGDGLALWLRADSAERTGGEVIGWPDRSASPSPTPATPVSASARPTWVPGALGGQPAVRFDGVDDALLLAPGLADLRRSGVTVAAVVRSTAPRRNAPVLALRTATGAGPVDLRRRGHGPDAVLSTGGALAGDVGFESTAPRLLMAVIGADATLTGPLGAVSGSLPRPAGVPRDASRIGRDAWGEAFAGDLAELLVWDRSLSTDEQDAVALALADRYGLWHPQAAWVAALPAGLATQAEAHRWTQEEAAAQATFASAWPGVPGAGLSVWLRADLGLTATGGAVSAWDDQSPAGGDATQAAAESRPELLERGVRFDGVDDSLALPAGFGRFEGATVIGVLRPGSSPPGAHVFEARTTGGDSVALSATPTLRWRVGGLEVSGAAIPGAVQVVSVTHGADGAVQVRRGGAPAGSGTLPLPATTLRDVASIGGTGATYAGDLHELLVWRRALPPAEVVAVEAAVADAWGAWHPQAAWVGTLADVGATLEDTALVAAHGWSKAHALSWLAWKEVWSADGPPGVGLGLWLRADTGVVQAGGALTAWTNLAPVEPGPPALPTTPAAAPTVQGGVHFDGVDDGLALPPGLALLDGGFTVVLVARPQGIRRWERLVDLQGPSGGDQVCLLRKADSAALQVRVGAATLSGAQALGPEARILSVVVGPGGATIRSQGVVRGSGALPLPTRALRDRSRLGQGADGTAAYGGDLVEVAVWERPLSGAELAAMEIALADAHGLYHPDAAWIAALPPEHAAIVHANRWNQDQAEAALP